MGERVRNPGGPIYTVRHNFTMAEQITIINSSTDEKSILVGEKKSYAAASSWQTGAANAERKKNNFADKKASKKSANSKKAPKIAKDDCPPLDTTDLKVPEDNREIVVHPWHLHFTNHVIDGEFAVIDADKTRKAGRYRISKYADNLEGTGLLRRVTGQGNELLPFTWGNFHYIEEACMPLVAEALGKLDVDLKYLVPRALVNLKTKVPVWPNASNEIFEYLTSSQFSNLITSYYTQRLTQTRTLLTAKCLRYAAKINASVDDVNKAVDLHLGARRWKLAFSWFVMWCLLTLAWTYALFMHGKLFKKEGLTVVAMLVKAFLFYRWIKLPPKVRIILAELESAKFAVSYGSLITIGASCSKGIKLPNLLDCWKYSLKPGVQELACKVKAAYNTFGTYIRGANMAIPNACHHDQWNGLCIRFFFARDYSSAAAKSCFENFKTLYMAGEIQLNGVWKWYSEEEWLAHLPGRRRAMLEEVPDAVNLEDYIGVDIFVKLEAYLGKNWDCFKARIIQGRQLAYQKLVGPFFYSLSKWIADCFSVERGNLIYDNGLDARQLGDIALRMFAEYKYVYEIDVSNWDGSLGPDALLFEMWFLRVCVPVYWSQLERVLKWWLKVRGAGKNGVSYSTKHGRRSGDMWTSSLNSVINLLILVWIFGLCILAVAKGDDNFFGTNSELTVDEIVALYASLGMTAKVKRITHISQLGYCSGTFYPVEGGWKWGLKPFRILSKFGLNLKRIPAKSHARILYGTAISMLPIAGHVPVLGNVLRAIVADGRTKGIIPILPDDEPWKNGSSQIDEVHPTCYGFFCDTYNFSIEDMDDLEWMTTYNVNQRRPLGIEDFPILFEDPRFFRGFAVDVGLDVVPDTSNVTITKPVANSLLTWLDFAIVVVLSPVWEELARWHLGIWFTLWIGLVESYFYYGITAPFVNLILHLNIHVIQWHFGPWAALLCHAGWNAMVFFLSQENRGHRLEVGYGSVINLLRFDEGTLSRRRAGVFTLISHCVALSKHRLSGFSAYLFDKRQHIKRGRKQFVKNSSKSKQKSGKQNQNKNKQQKNKGSLGRSLLKTGLTGLGSMLGPGVGAFGSQLGDWGANILGMGDYEIKHNTLDEGQGVPHMHGDGNIVRIRHREYLGDVTGSVGFVSNSYSIQPGSSKTFPWISNIAGMFQQYKIHGMAFEFNSMSADALNSVNTALGTVIMSTQYNVAFPEFVNKAEMEQYQYTSSGRPSKNQIHLIECAPNLQVMSQLFLRTGSLPAGQDYQFYDWGKFQIATVGMQAAANIGELWVTYDIEFLKPRIASGGAWPGDFTRINNGPFDATNPLGLIQTNPFGNLGASVVAGPAGWQRLYLPNSVTAGRFLVTIRWLGTVNALVSSPVRNYSNLAIQNTNFQLSSTGEVFTPNAAVNSARFQYTAVVTVNGYNVNGSYIEFDSATGTLPGTPTNVDIVIVALPLSDVGF